MLSKQLRNKLDIQLEMRMKDEQDKPGISQYNFAK